MALAGIHERPIAMLWTDRPGKSGPKTTTDSDHHSVRSAPVPRRPPNWGRLPTGTGCHYKCGGSGCARSNLRMVSNPSFTGVAGRISASFSGCRYDPGELPAALLEKLNAAGVGTSKAITARVRGRSVPPICWQPASLASRGGRLYSRKTAPAVSHRCASSASMVCICVQVLQPRWSALPAACLAH